MRTTTTTQQRPQEGNEMSTTTQETRAERLARTAAHAVALAGCPATDDTIGAAIEAVTEITLGHPNPSAKELAAVAHRVAVEMSKRAAADLVRQTMRAEVVRESVAVGRWTTTENLTPAQIRGLADTLTAGDAYAIDDTTGAWSWSDEKCRSLVAQWLGEDARKLAALQRDELHDRMQHAQQYLAGMLADSARNSARIAAMTPRGQNPNDPTEKASTRADALALSAEGTRNRRPDWQPRSATNRAGFPHTDPVTLAATMTARRLTIGNYWSWPQIPDDLARGVNTARISGPGVGTDSLGTAADHMYYRTLGNTVTRSLQTGPVAEVETPAPVQMRPDDALTPRELAARACAPTPRTVSPAMARFLAVCDAEASNGREQSLTPDLDTAPDTAEVFAATSGDDLGAAILGRLARLGDAPAARTLAAIAAAVHPETGNVRWRQVANRLGTPQRPDALRRSVQAALAALSARELAAVKTAQKNAAGEQLDTETRRHCSDCGTRLRIGNRGTKCAAHADRDAFQSLTATVRKDAARRTAERLAAFEDHGRAVEQMRAAAIAQAEQHEHERTEHDGRRTDRYSRRPAPDYEADRTAVLAWQRPDDYRPDTVHAWKQEQADALALSLADHSAALAQWLADNEQRHAAALAAQDGE